MQVHRQIPILNENIHTHTALHCTAPCAPCTIKHDSFFSFLRLFCASYLFLLSLHRFEADAFYIHFNSFHKMFIFFLRYYFIVVVLVYSPPFYLIIWNKYALVFWSCRLNKKKRMKIFNHTIYMQVPRRKWKTEEKNNNNNDKGMKTNGQFHCIGHRKQRKKTYLQPFSVCRYCWCCC